MATVSNLLEDDLPWDEQAARGELRSIVADGVRLNNCIGSLLDLSRLEAHAWAPRREPCELAEIVDASLDRVPHICARGAERAADELPLVEIDFGQWLRVFQNLLETRSSRRRAKHRARQCRVGGEVPSPLGRGRRTGHRERAARGGLREVLSQPSLAARCAVLSGPVSVWRSCARSCRLTKGRSVSRTSCRTVLAL